MIRHLQPGFLAFSLFVSSPWAQSATTLRDAADAAGLNIGIATNSFNVSNSSYASAAKEQFNLVVCENEMKFDQTEGPIGSFKYSAGDAVSAFAVANKMKMRGHNFIWHSQSTTAQAAVHDRASGLTVMRNHIEAVGAHFKDKILEWDVLNEITDVGTANKLRNATSRPPSFWEPNIGEDFSDSALAIARRVIGTSGYLYYNDFDADGVNAKSNAIISLVKKWQTNKVPIDGIGLQSHLQSPVNKDDISANIKRFGDLGVRISMTEIDIQGATAADWTALIGACLENFNCVSFVTWGLSDANSWRGSGCGCLLYNGTPPTPKAAMIQAVLDALNHADPAIAAKRKAFAAQPPGSLIPPLGIRFAHPATHRVGDRLFGASSIPVFSIGSGTVDALGRNKTLSPAPASFPGLDILPQ
jgi:endo-1,4-beta-xylanase